jgi:hypothetical protein
MHMMATWETSTAQSTLLKHFRLILRTNTSLVGLVSNPKALSVTKLDLRVVHLWVGLVTPERKARRNRAGQPR